MPNWLSASINRTTAYDIPASPGCYAVFHGTRLIYIGMSGNLKRRIHAYNIENVCGPNHWDGWTKTPWGDFPWDGGKLRGRIRTARSINEAADIERRLIARLNPACNIRGRSDRGR